VIAGLLQANRGLKSELRRVRIMAAGREG
jgi:hypothetical protein